MFRFVDFVVYPVHLEFSIVTPLTPGSDTQKILLCLTPDDFTHQLEVFCS